jgi:hypothetical protein
MSEGRSSHDLSRELAVLSDVFSDLGERLGQAARQLHTPGTPPPDALVEALSLCRRDFVNLRDRTRELAGSLRVPCPPDDGPDGLQDLAALLGEIAEAEARQATNEDVRRRAVAILDRVGQVSHVSDAEFSPLLDCHARARALRDAIVEGDWAGLPEEVGPLAAGEHAFAHLIALIEERDELSDDQWANLHESVGLAFGKPVAAAAARSKLTLALEPAAASVGG